LEQLYGNLTSATEAADAQDVRSGTTGAGPLRVTVDGQVYLVAKADADALANQIALAYQQIGPGSIAEKAPTLDIQEVGVSAQLPAGAELTSALLGAITVQTVEGASVSLSVTPKTLAIRASGVVVTTGPFQSARLNGATVTFPNGTISV